MRMPIRMTFAFVNKPVYKFNSININRSDHVYVAFIKYVMPNNY